MQANPLLYGQFGKDFYARQALLAGTLFVRQAAFVLVYRGRKNFQGWGHFPWGRHAWSRYATPTTDDLPCGRAEESSTTVSILGQELTPTYYTAYWQYLLGHVGSLGLESSLGPAGIVGVDAAGDLVLPAGNAPASIYAEARADGYVVLSWIYAFYGEPATPTGFSLLRWVAGAWSEIQTVSYVPGRARYAVTLGPYSHGAAERLLVRTYRAVGLNIYTTGNADYSEVTVDAQGPPAVAYLRITS